MLPKELKFLIQKNNSTRKTIRVGDILFFGYNSNNSFYDRFPLVLVISVKKNNDYNYLGFNLHFIPPDYRILLLNQIKDSGIETARDMSREEIPRRYFTNSIKRYKLENVMTPIKIFERYELGEVINTIIPSYDSKSEVEIIKYLDNLYIDEKRG